MVIAVDRSKARLWQRSRKILCVRLDALGDVIMTGPAPRLAMQGFGMRRLNMSPFATMIPGGRKDRSEQRRTSWSATLRSRSSPPECS